MKMYMSCSASSNESAAEPQQFKDGSNYFFYRPSRELTPLEFLVSESEPDNVLVEIDGRGQKRHYGAGHFLLLNCMLTAHLIRCVFV